MNVFKCLWVYTYLAGCVTLHCQPTARFCAALCTLGSSWRGAASLKAKASFAHIQRIAYLQIVQHNIHTSNANNRASIDLHRSFTTSVCVLHLLAPNRPLMDDQELDQARPERRQRVELEAGPDLAGLLRILGRQRVVVAPERARAGTNAELVGALKESSMLNRWVKSWPLIN